MKIVDEISFSEFEPWSGAVETYNKICDCGKEEEFEQYIEEIYPEGCSSTTINDILWFEADDVFEYLGIKNFEVGDTVDITDGEWEDYSGTIVKIYDDDTADVEIPDEDENGEEIVRTVNIDFDDMEN